MSKSSIFKLTNGTNMCIFVQNPRLLVINPVGKQYEVIKDGELVEIDYCGEFNIKKGKIITIDKQKYKIQRIKKESSQGVAGEGYYLYIHNKLSKTSNFIFPYLGKNRDYFKWNENFVNSFIGTEEHGDYGTSIYLLYRYDGSINFFAFEKVITEHPWYKETVDTDKYHVLFRFDIPDDFLVDIEKIINGKYSRISEKGKEQILRFHNTTKDKPLGDILYRAESRKKQLEEDLSEPHNGSIIKISESADLLDPFDIEEEIFMNYYIIEDDGITRRKETGFAGAEGTE